MTTSASFLSLCLNMWTLHESSGFWSLVLDSLSVSWHRVLSFILIYVTDILDDENLLITCGKQLPPPPLSDGAHRHFPVKKVRAATTSLATGVHASSHKIGFKFKAVALRAGKLGGRFHTDVSLNWRQWVPARPVDLSAVFAGGF